MWRGPEFPETTQEALVRFKAERGRVSQQMQSLGEGGNPEEFAKLFLEEMRLDLAIKELKDSIIPEHGHGAVSEDTLRSSRGPEGIRKA